MILKKQHKKLALSAMALAVAVPSVVAVTTANAESPYTLDDRKIYSETLSDLTKENVRFDAIKGLTANKVGIAQDKTLYVWNNADNQPVQVVKDVKFKNVGNARDIWYAVSESGDLYTWGDNAFGALGHGATTKLDKPKKVEGISKVKEVTVTPYGIFTIVEDGSVFYMGAGAEGQSGLGDTDNVTKPTKLEGLSNVTHIEVIAGVYNRFPTYVSVFAQTSNGELYGWGSGKKATNGVSTSAVLTPTKIEGVPNVKKFHYYHTLSGDAPGSVWLETEEGELYGMGSNWNGALGVGSTDEQVPTPKKVVGVSGIKNFEAKELMAVTEDGELFAWGSNSNFKLGNGSDKTAIAYTPVKVPLENVVDVEVSQQHALVVLKNGDVYTWGTDTSARQTLGTGSTAPITTPQKISGLSNIVAVFEDVDTVGALGADGSLYTWGFNANGQVGNGTTNNVSRPYKVNIPPVKEVLTWGNKQAVIVEGDIIHVWGAGTKTPATINGTSGVMIASNAFYDKVEMNLTVSDDRNNNLHVRAPINSPNYTLNKMRLAHHSTVTFKALTDNAVQMSWEPSPGATNYTVKRNGSVLYTGTETHFVDNNAIYPGVEYTYEVTVQTTLNPNTTVIKYTHGEEPDFTAKPEPTPTEPIEPPTKTTLWTFDSPTGEFVTTMIPEISVLGGKVVEGVTLNKVDLGSAKTVTTEHGDVVFTPDGNGNTIVSLPNGLGSETTDTTVDVQYNGTSILTVVVKPKPVIKFNFGF